MSRDTPSAEPALRRWLAASTINVAGTLATAAALPVVVFEATQDAAAVGLLGVLAALPYLVLGLAAGHLADHTGRRGLMVVGLLLAALVAAGQAAGLAGGPRLVLVYGLALAAATLFVVTDAAEFGLLPQVLPAAQLPRAWGLSTAWYDGCAVAVPPVATAVVATAGASWVLAADAASFVLAAVLVAGLVPVVPQEPPAVTADAAGDDWRAGARFVLKHPVLRPLVLAGFFNSAAFGLVTGLLVVYAVRGLGVPSAGAQVGVVVAAVAVGGIATGATFGRLYRPHRVRLLSCAGTTGCALCVVALAGTGSPIVAVLLLACFGALLAVTVTAGIVYRQQVAPERLRSRVMTVGRMIAWGGQPLGAGIGGVVAQARGIRPAYLLAAVLFAVAALVAARGRPADDPRS